MNQKYFIPPTTLAASPRTPQTDDFGEFKEVKEDYSEKCRRNCISDASPIVLLQIMHCIDMVGLYNPI